MEKQISISAVQYDMYIKAVEDLARAKMKIEELEAEAREKDEMIRSALEIIRHDDTLAKQSTYWRSMLLTLVEGLAIDKELIEQHVDFHVKMDGEGALSTVVMAPKTSKGMKLMQVWGVIDMLKELVTSLRIEAGSEEDKEEG